MSLRSCLVAFSAVTAVLLQPALASDQELSDQARATGLLATQAAMKAAGACFSVVHLALSAHEAKTMGAKKEAVALAALQGEDASPAMQSAIDIGFEIDRITDSRLTRLFSDCLKRGERDLQRFLLP